MPHLKTEPPGTLATLDELFALADAMERAAAERYAAFASRMHEDGRDDLASVFEAIAAEESRHVDGVAAVSMDRVGHRPDERRLPWPALPTFEPEDEAAIAGSAALTPYRALSIAVRNEERAFVLWSWLAAHAQRDDVRKAAERMAKEELGHIAIFRRERRKAFHRERGAARAWLSAAEAEARLAAMLSGQGPADPDSGPPGRDGEPSGRISTQDVKVCAGPAITAAELAERLADAYLQAAEQCRDEADLADLLAFAERAILRLAASRALE